MQHEFPTCMVTVSHAIRTEGRAHAHATKVKVELDSIYVVVGRLLRGVQPRERDRVVDLETMQPRIRTAATRRKLYDSV